MVTKSACQKKNINKTRRQNTEKHITDPYQGLHSTKVLSRQAYFGRDKRRVLGRKTRVCDEKTFVATKIILVAAPANDTIQTCQSTTDQGLHNRCTAQPCQSTTDQGLHNRCTAQPCQSTTDQGLNNRCTAQPCQSTTDQGLHNRCTAQPCQSTTDQGLNNRCTAQPCQSTTDQGLHSTCT